MGEGDGSGLALRRLGRAKTRERNLAKGREGALRRLGELKLRREVRCGVVG